MGVLSHTYTQIPNTYLDTRKTHAHAPKDTQGSGEMFPFALLRFMLTVAKHTAPSNNISSRSKMCVCGVALAKSNYELV